MEQFGIEALSRGAKKTYFCDNNKEAIKVLNRNLEKTRLISKAIIINKNYSQALEDIKEEMDLVFLDPPYKLNLSIEAIKQMVNLKLINNNTLIIIETDEPKRDTEEIQRLQEIEIIDKRKYGRANLIFVKKRGS